MARNPTAASPSDTQRQRSIALREDGFLTVRDAASVLGMTPQGVRKWLDQGCPHQAGGQGRANPAMLRLIDVIRWREVEAAGGDEAYNEGAAKAADWHYRAIIRQADARKNLGSLVPVDLIADVVEEDYQRVRDRLNSVPARLSVQVAAETDAAIVRSMIQRAIHDALANLASPDDVIERAGGDPAASVYDPLELDEEDDDADEEQDADAVDD